MIKTIEELKQAMEDCPRCGSLGSIDHISEPQIIKLLNNGLTNRGCCAISHINDNFKAVSIFNGYKEMSKTKWEIQNRLRFIGRVIGNAIRDREHELIYSKDQEYSDEDIYSSGLSLLSRIEENLLFCHEIIAELSE